MHSLDATMSIVFFVLAWVYAREGPGFRPRSYFAATYIVGLLWLWALINI